MEEDLVTVRARGQALEHLLVEAGMETARLELLRDRLLDRGLGMVWWIEKYADLQFATGDPAVKSASVINAFQLISNAVRTETVRAMTDDASVIRARVEELLTTLVDPASANRAVDLLETVLRTLAPHHAQSAEPSGASSSGARIG